ncbi:MAG: DUF2207 domain-containing protein, partial [Atribacterota bacterium]|nr:DUF2207 domain-containing protein [Atribacterota bacterium]
EIFTYEFSGNFNGIIRSIGLIGSDGLQYFQASQYLPQQKILDITRETEGNMVTFRIYDQSSNERKSFLLEYQLKNVVTKYNDIAEFYWKFFDQSNSSPVQRVQIEVSFPGQILNADELKVFGHGPSQGQVSILDRGVVLYEVESLSANEMLEARILFPTSIVPNAGKIVNKDQYAQIMQEELNWAKSSDRENLFMLFGLLLIPVMIILNIITAIRLYFKYDRELKPEIELDYYRELPSDITPAVLSHLMNIQGADTKDIMATLMDLTRKKYLQIEEITSQGRMKKKDYRFILLNMDAGSLKQHEINLINWFFYSIGNGESVTLKEIENYSKSSRTQSSFRHQYLKWQEAVKKEFKKYNYFGKSKEGLKVAFKTVVLEIAGFLVLIIGTILLRVSWFVLIPLLMTILITGMGLIIYGGLIRKKTQEGVNEYEKWSAFKRFLLHFSNIKDYEIPSLVIWEHYLVYAISLGVAEKVISKLRVALADQNINMRNSALLYHMTDRNGQLNTSVFRSFDKAFNNSLVRTSPSKGSGGGFSSGGGRGGGGGGAGAF